MELLFHGLLDHAPHLRLILIWNKLRTFGLDLFHSEAIFAVQLQDALAMVG